VEEKTAEYIILSSLLAVNAFFIRNLVKSINDMKVELAKLLTSQKYTASSLETQAHEIKDLYEKYGSLSSRVITLEEKVKKN